MKNYIQAGVNITVAAAATVASGDGVLIGSLFGVATGDAAIGENVTLVRQGVFSLPKLSTEAWTVGEKIYWDGAECTTVSTANALIGFAAEIAANPTPTGIVILDGAAR